MYTFLPSLQEVSTFPFSKVTLIVHSPIFPLSKARGCKVSIYFHFMMCKVVYISQK